MKVTLISVPYNYGQVGRHVGAGLGPVRYLEGGAEAALTGQGFEVAVVGVERRTQTEDTLAAVAEVGALVREQVSGAIRQGAFPVVLSGGCSTCLGTLAALGPEVGIIWFDAHGDFNTPETTPSGFFEGMPLAVATGLCHEPLWRQITTNAPASPTRVILAGVRDLDPGEHENIKRSGAQAVTAGEMKQAGVTAALGPALEALRRLTRTVYLHFDIDALDPAFAPGVDYRSPGGLSLEEAEEAVGLIAQQFRVGAAALTAYNPEHEQNGRTLQSGLRMLQALCRAARGGV